MAHGSSASVRCAVIGARAGPATERAILARAKALIDGDGQVCSISEPLPVAKSVVA